MKEWKIVCLLLKIENGTPPSQTALRQITDKIRSFGPGALFDCPMNNSVDCIAHGLSDKQ